MVADYFLRSAATAGRVTVILTIPRAVAITITAVATAAFADF